MLRMEPDGTPIDGVVSAPIELNYTGNNRYGFSYDWRLDPFVIAEQLRQYIADVKQETNMISPDRQIDASTCLFPYNTWFIKGLFHSEQPEDYHFKVLTAIAYGDLDITTDPEFPQYLIVDSEDDQRINPYLEEEEKEETFIEKIWAFFQKADTSSQDTAQ